MAALPGEPWRGASVARHFVSATPANFRSAWITAEVSTTQPTANLATWTGAVGSTLTLRFRWTSGGTPTGSAPNFATVNVRLPSDGSNIGATWSVAFPAVDTDVTQTFHFDDNPLNGSAGTNRGGMIEVFFSWGNTGGVTPWSADSRGGGTPAALNSIDHARGYYRSPVRLATYSVSNASLGGAEPALFCFPDSIFQRATLDAITYRSVAFSNTLRQAGAAKRTNAGTAGTAVQRDYTNSGTSATTGRVNNGFTVGSTATDVRFTTPSNVFGGSADKEYAWDSTGHVAGFSVSGDDLTDTARFTADPRLTFSQVLQLNNATFQTPPTLLDVASGERLTSDLAFLAARAVNQRATPEGQNGLAWTEKLWDAGELVGSEASPVATRAATSAAKGGQDGWSDAFLTWDESLPGGSWTHKQTITTADATGLELTNTRTLTLVAANPSIAVLLGGGGTDEGNIFYPGVTFQAGLGAMNVSTKLPLEIDGGASIAILRLQDTGANAGRAEYLASDLTWTRADNAAEIYFWPATETIAGSSKIYIVQFTAGQTASWGSYDLALLGRAVISGVPYSGRAGVLTISFNLEDHAHLGSDGSVAIGER